MLNLCSWHRKGHCLLVSSFSVMSGYVSRLLVSANKFAGAEQAGTRDTVSFTLRMVGFL